MGLLNFIFWLSPVLGLDEKPAMAARPKLMHGPVRSVKKRTPAPASSECCTPRAVNGVGRFDFRAWKILRVVIFAGIETPPVSALLTLEP